MKSQVSSSQSNHLEEVCQEAKKRYDISTKLTAITGGYQNAIYRFEKGHEPYILRITDVSLRTHIQIEGELEWLTYLFKHNVPLSKPVASKHGNMLEHIQTDKNTYYATVFEYATGDKLTYPDYLGNVELYEQLGEITAKLHKASQTYKPSKVKRHSYVDNYYLNNVSTFIPKEKTKIHNAAKQLMQRLNTLEKDESVYGLIHGDINVGNFHYDGKQVTLFDFDECQYSWYIEDIAIQLYYTIFVFGDSDIDERNKAGKRFMKHFMKGYNKYLRFDQKWMELIPLFLKLREIILYVGIHKKWDFDNLNQWQKDFLRDSTKRIENDIPVYDTKFSNESY